MLCASSLVCEDAGVHVQVFPVTAVLCWPVPCCLDVTGPEMDVSQNTYGRADKLLTTKNQVPL